MKFYLSISSVCPSVSIPIETGPYLNLPTHSTLPYQQHPPLSLPYTASIPIEIRSKRLRAETTHQLTPKRPTPKIGRNDPGRNDPAETTQGRNDPDSYGFFFCGIAASEVRCISIYRVQTSLTGPDLLA